METIVTCVTCKQVLTGGACTNALCPGYTEDVNVEQEERIAALEAERERYITALRRIRELVDDFGDVGEVARAALKEAK